jgi:hypothetical protein
VADQRERGILCLRCDSQTLTVTDTAGDLTFYECPQCLRRYTLHASGLTERWPGPISVALYGVIMDPRPQDRDMMSVAASLSHLDTAQIVSAIRLELADPRQNVRDILTGLVATEADLREYLSLLVDALERR